MAKKASRKRAGEPKKVRVYALMAVCGLVLVSGFFIAGRQHFSSMDYGMKNSKLRKQIDDLEAEKRRLILAREMSLSPTALTQVAKKIGLNATASKEAAAPEMASLKTEPKAAPSSPDQKALVVKTASVEKTLPVATTAALKTDSSSIKSAIALKNSIKKTIVTPPTE